MPSYAIKTFGCQMNIHDSERIEETLRDSGYQPCADPALADLIVVNTCSVREKAEQKLRSLIGTLADLKRRRPEVVIAVAGCVAQQEGEKLLGRMKQVDVVVGPDNIAELPRLVEASQGGAPPTARTVFDVDDPVFLRARPDAARSNVPTAFVTIMKGCDERCSFCIVPHTRGPERYRPSTEVIAEIDLLVAAGVREVTLLGQTVNSYRDPSQRLERAPMADPSDGDESEFAALLRSIAEAVPNLARLRYTSPHPRHVTPSLVAAHRDLDVLARHVHLPVQSGSDRILKRMIRRYSRAEYLGCAEALREARGGLTLSTDIIVGFPGETDEDFEQTLALVKEVRFSSLFGFQYSERPYTPARKLDDDISPEQKQARLAALFALSNQLQREHLASLVGSTQDVLVEGQSKTGSGRVAGRTVRNEIVHIADDAGASLVGELARVHVVRAFDHSLEGVLIDGSRAGRAPAHLAGAKRTSLPVLASDV